MKIHVDDLEFNYTKMKLRAQMKIWPLLAKDLGPILPKLKELQSADLVSPEGQMGVFGMMLREAAGVLEHAEEYYAAVAAQTEAKFHGKWHELALFEDQIFQHGGQVIEFTIQDLQEEFGPLLSSLDAKAAPEPSVENQSK